MTIRGGGGIARDQSSAVKAALTPRPDQSSTHSQAGSGRSGWADGSDASVEIYCHAMSHPEIFGFQDVIKIRNKTTIFS